MKGADKLWELLMSRMRKDEYDFIYNARFWIFFFNCFETGGGAEQCGKGRCKQDKRIRMWNGQEVTVVIAESRETAMEMMGGGNSF